MFGTMLPTPQMANTDKNYKKLSPLQVVGMSDLMISLGAMCSPHLRAQFSNLATFLLLLGRITDKQTELVDLISR